MLGGKEKQHAGFVAYKPRCIINLFTRERKYDTKNMNKHFATEESSILQFVVDRKREAQTPTDGFALSNCFVEKSSSSPPTQVSRKHECYCEYFKDKISPLNCFLFYLCLRLESYAWFSLATQA